MERVIYVRVEIVDPDTGVVERSAVHRIETTYGPDVRRGFERICNATIEWPWVIMD